MSGHAILNSCHNCGKKNVHLNIVNTNENCDIMHNTKLKNHIHIFTACDECKKNFWDNLKNWKD